MSKLFVLSGSSACGKTTLMNSVLKENSSLTVIQKYGTRRRRPAKDGIEDDVCQVFDSPFPQEIKQKELDEKTDLLLSSIWEKVSNDSCCLKNNLSPEKKTIFTKIINEPYYFEKESKITCKEVKALLLYKLKQFYVFQDKAFEIKSDLSNHKKHLLSHFLEDLDIRNPLIRLGEDKYWDDCGKKVPLKGNIDIAYALNKGQYGICTENVWSELKVGKNVITILSDFRIITRLKKIFKDSILVIYVASAVDTAKLEKIQIARLGIDQSKEDSIKKKVNRLNSSINIKKWGNVAKVIHELNEDWEKTKPDADSTRFRAERIKTFHTRYIDNITLFDYVILNYNEGHPEDMTVQFNNIFKANNKNLLNKSPLFVVTAASNAGKGTMMEMLNLIGSDRVQILSKIAKRKEKGNDKNDGMLPIGTLNNPPQKWPFWPDWWDADMVNSAKKGEFPKEYDFSWSFHGKSVYYAVCDKEIKYNFEKNKSQIVISNTDQIEKFISRYGDRVIFILLYRLSSIEDTKSYYEIEEGLSPEDAAWRASEVTKVLHEYIKKIGYFNHVILNTTRPEDLYDQIFQLVEFYHFEKNRINRLSDLNSMDKITT